MRYQELFVPISHQLLTVDLGAALGDDEPFSSLVARTSLRSTDPLR